jgi:hypothetical protein
MFWFTFYVKIHLIQTPRTIGSARILRRNVWAPFVLIYAGLVHVLR